ncbi:hypothetical protein BDY19DRAFT_998770 [Irpex rosettiformis]|uniref:Uncharacterized protein n=1 Tax=Irpex rosettiformis TaxID=378272 RepID=A0ACB8TMI1_9APHY|nr:hypothetical protein BDY19DRAFT_998770 [Irpex rosettiformis]
MVQPHQISMRRDSNRAIATDSEGHELRINDNVKEVDGEGRKGKVLHTHQSFFAFLFNRDYSENGGVFVTRARSLVSLAPKSNTQKLGATDLSKMNPALNPALRGSAQGGLRRTIKDTNGNLARVELISGNKVVQIEKDKLKRRNPDASLEPLEAIAPRGIMGPPSSTPASWINNTPGWTPNPYTSGGRTPAPMGGKNPAWNMDSSRTPRGKTPSWNVSRTPNPYADGGRSSRSIRRWQASRSQQNIGRRFEVPVRFYLFSLSQLRPSLDTTLSPRQHTPPTTCNSGAKYRILTESIVTPEGTMKSSLTSPVFLTSKLAKPTLP